MGKVLISGYYGFGNFGDETILGIICSHLKSINSDVTVLSADPDKTSKQHSVKSVHSFDIKSVLKEISKCDTLISGGGSLLQDVTSRESLLYYTFIISIAILLRKKVIIFAQGIGPLKSIFSKFIVFNLLGKCWLVTVRDDKSLELMKSHGIDAVKIDDPIFSLPIKNAVKRNVIGVQLRDFEGVTDEFLENLAKNIADNFSGKKIKLISLQDSIDAYVLNKFKSKLKACGLKAELLINLNQNEIISQISSLDTLIAMRFHAIVVALKSATKILAINYDTKVEKLANEFNLPILEMNDFTDYPEIFKNIKMHDVPAFKDFDWSIFDEIIQA